MPPTATLRRCAQSTRTYALSTRSGTHIVHLYFASFSLSYPKCILDNSTLDANSYTRFYLCEHMEPDAICVARKEGESSEVVTAAKLQQRSCNSSEAVTAAKL